MTDDGTEPSQARAPDHLHNRYGSDTTQVLVLRLAGVRLHPDGQPRLELRRAVPFVALSLLPVVLAATVPSWHAVSGAQSSFKYFGWLLYFVFLDLATVCSAWFSCRNFHRITPDLDQCLSSRGYDEYDRWATRNLRLWRQLRLMITVGVAGAVVLLFAQRAPMLESRLYISPASYLSVFWTAALASNCGHWLFHGILLSKKLAQRDRMSLLWVAPARTPGIEGLARVYRAAFYVTSLGASLFLVPLLSWSKEAGGNNGGLTVIKLSLVVASGLMALGVAIAPQICLSVAVIRERKASILALQAQLPQVDDIANVPSTSTVGALLKTVTDSPQTTINDRTIVALIIGLTAATLPGVLQLVLTR